MREDLNLEGFIVPASVREAVVFENVLGGLEGEQGVIGHG